MPEDPLSVVPLRIQLFGPMQVLVEGAPFPSFRSRKGMWLLALLILRHGRPVERDWLAGTLWPDMDRPQALANLRPILSELRNGLGSQKERLQSPDRHTLQLMLTGADVDLVTFDTTIHRSPLTDLEQAVNIYLGPLLEGCTEEWVFQERHHREQSCLKALQKLADAAHKNGDPERAIPFYERAVRLDPWSDSLRRGWMEALVKRGDRNAALQVYRDFVDMLKDDPRATPDEQTTALYLRLRTEARTQARTTTVAEKETPPPPRVVGYLPHPLTGIIGREDERLEVATRLRRSRLLTLTGMGGIGKTRLALEVAREVAREYEDGAWFVSLDVLTEREQVVPQIAAVLGLKEEVDVPLQNTLTRSLRGKNVLLVIDNCEHLAGAVASCVASLLVDCGGLRILATSREALEVPGETVWVVPSLATPAPAHLPEGNTTLLRVLQSYESIQLFVQRATSVQQTFTLNTHNARTVASICAQLEGIPLAIELAAARVKAMTVEQVATRLREEWGLLSRGKRMAPSRQQTLRSTLDWSYDMLSAPEQTLFRRLSVFVGGWSSDAAEEIVTDEIVERPLVVTLLRSLVDKSLVVFEEQASTGEGRYRLLEIVRQYAQAKLRDSGEAEAWEGRHRDWFVTVAERAEQGLTGPDQKTCLDRLTMEYGNLQAVMARGGNDAADVSAGLRLTGALWRYWYMRGDYLEGRRRLQEALAHDTAQLPTHERGKALHGEGIMHYRLGHFHAAKECLEKAKQIRTQIGDRRGLGGTLFNLGNTAFSLGEYEAGQELYRQCLEIRREFGDTHGIAVALGNMGHWALQRSDLTEAKTRYQESLALLRELGDRYQVAWALDNLGIIASQQGDYATALVYLEESVPIFEELGERRGVAWSLHKIAAIDQGHGRYDVAQERYQESLTLFQAMGDGNGIACTYHELGMVAMAQGNQEAAHRWLEQGRQLFEASGFTFGIAHSHHGLGRWARLNGDLQAAQAFSAESLRRFQTLDSKKGILDSMLERALLRAEALRYTEVACLLGAMQHLAQSIGLKPAPVMRATLDTLTESTRIALGCDVFAQRWQEGRTLPLEEVIERALLA